MQTCIIDNPACAAGGAGERTSWSTVQMRLASRPRCELYSQLHAVLQTLLLPTPVLHVYVSPCCCDTPVAVVLTGSHDVI